VTERIVVIGADGAGMSAASIAKRMRGHDVEVIAFDRGPFSSYSACGVPYWIAGDVADGDALIARTPEQHRANGIDLRMRHLVEGIDRGAGEVSVHDLEGGRALRVGFDQLVIATGARPVRPDLPGVTAAGVLGVQNLEDGAAIRAELERGARRAVVVGAGYIGIEMAEAMVRRGLQVVTVLEGAEQPMSTLDPELGAKVAEAMAGMGMTVQTATKVTGFLTDPDGRVRAVTTDGGEIAADLVVLGIGVRPEVALAREAGLTIGERGGIRTDDHQRVLGTDNIWSGGDCVEVRDRISGQYLTIALGTHANRHGRVIGSNLGGRDAVFPGVIGTAISKVCNLEIGRTGLGSKAAADAGFDAVSVTVEGTTQAGYMPGTGGLTVKVIAERGSGRLLGAQIVGRGPGAGKRIDTFATAIWAGLTAGDLADADLSYAPPFSPTFDAVTIAARQAATAARS
jgi:NADPH-dependent 2,4-dienoyl-CoA reductase/sulfur reductase-like enzyme